MSRGRPWLAALALAAAALAFCRAGASGQQRPLSRAGADEAFFQLTYTGVDTLITALYARGQVYVPLTGVFRALRIDVSLEPGARVARGFYLEPATPYELDLDRKTLRVGSRSLELDSTSVIADPLEIYVRPEVIERAFGFEIVASLSDLVLRVTSTVPLPILETIRRDQARALGNQPGYLQPPAPLLFPLRHPLLDGFTLAYGVSANSDFGLGQHTSSIDLGMGGRLAGGDIVAQAELSAGKVNRFGSTGARWRYEVGDPLRRITQIALGTVSAAAGVRTVRIDGLQVTNEPTEPRARLGQQVVDGHVGPDWEVEIYSDRELAGFLRTGPDGNYRFVVPVRRGSALITLKFYGPNGEFRTEERRLQAPLVFVPAGSFDYTLGLGRTREGWGALQGTAAYGITGALAAEMGIDLLDAEGERPAIPSFRLAYRLPWSAAAALQVAPGAYERMDASVTFPSQSSLILQSTRYLQPDRLFNSLLARNELRLTGNARVRLGGPALNVRTIGTFWQPWDGGKALDLNVGTDLDLFGFRPFIDWHGYAPLLGSGTGAGMLHTVTTGVIHAISRPPRRLAFLTQTLITASGVVGAPPFNLADARVELAKTVHASTRLTLGAGALGTSHLPYLSMRMDLDLPGLLASTVARAGSHMSSLAQTVRGEISLDRPAGAVRVDSRPWLGTGAAALRPFLDYNGDGRRQPDEPSIPNVHFTLREGTGPVAARDTVSRVVGLLPYVRYSVKVDASEVPNPLWLPRDTAFSFVSEPNVYRGMDVPFYAAATVSGSVQRALESGRSEPLPGLMVHLRGARGFSISVQTFQDGSFYITGVPPGDFDVMPDSAQLAILRASAEPRASRIHVRTTRDGDELGGIDFILRNLPPAPVAEDKSRPGAAPKQEQPPV